MINITHKNTTLRKAKAQAIVKLSSEEALTALRENRVPKGNVLEAAKTAALFAVKRTSDMIPDCHPLLIEFCHVHSDIGNSQIIIEVEVHTVYKTGVEVEAMHGAMVAALTMYDMLKPLDKNIEITGICLLEKSGGKSDFQKKEISGLKAAVVVCSDTIAAGKKEDRAGKKIIEQLEKHGIMITDYIIIPDETEIIREKAKHFSAQKLNLIIFTGGTGLSPRDVTPEALEALLEKRIPGIEETLRNYGQQRTPYSMLSRSMAGLMGNTLVLALPGSTRGAEESMQAIFPEVIHLFKVMQGARHEEVKESAKA